MSTKIVNPIELKLSTVDGNALLALKVLRSATWREPVDTVADLPEQALEGEARVVRDRGNGLPAIYIYADAQWTDYLLTALPQHEHVESDITDLNKYDQATVDSKDAAVAQQAADDLAAHQASVSDHSDIDLTGQQDTDFLQRVGGIWVPKKFDDLIADIDVHLPFEYFKKISGTYGLWIADKGVTLNGSKVSAWANQAGDAADFLQATEENQFYLATNVKNGRAALDSRGEKSKRMTGDDAATAKFLHDGTPYTLTIVFQINALGTNKQYFGNMDNNFVGGLANIGLIISQFNNDNLLIRMGNASGTSFVISYSQALGVGWYILSISYESGSAMRIKWNGDGFVNSSELASPSSLNAEAMRLGARSTNSPDRYVPFLHIVKGRIMSDEERNEMHSRLNAIYGVY